MKPARDIYQLLIEDEVFDKEYKELDIERKEAFIDLIKPRMKSLLDIKDKFALYYSESLSYKIEDVKKTVFSEEILPGIKKLIDVLKKLKEFSAEAVEDVLRKTAEECGLKAGDLIHPSRLAITSETVSPGVFDVFAFFGKDESIKRLNHFVKQVERDALPD